MDVHNKRQQENASPTKGNNLPDIGGGGKGGIGLP